MEKCFNTAGPCNPAEYYMLPALDRLPVFDEDKSRPWEEKLYNRTIEFGGKTLHVVGL